MNSSLPSKVVPALAGGTLIGLTAFFAFNCCSLLVFVGGALSSYLYLKDYPVSLLPVKISDVILLGLMAAVVGVLISGAFSMLGLALGLSKMALLTPLIEELVRRDLIEPRIARLILEKGVSTGSFWVVALSMAATFARLVIYSILTPIGALIGLAIFAPQAPPPAQSSAPQAPQSTL